MTRASSLLLLALSFAAAGCGEDPDPVLRETIDTVEALASALASCRDAPTAEAVLPMVEHLVGDFAFLRMRAAELPESHRTVEAEERARHGAALTVAMARLDVELSRLRSNAAVSAILAAPLARLSR